MNKRLKIKKIKNALAFAVSLIMSLSFLLGALLSTLLHFVYNPAFYVDCMRRAGVLEETGVDVHSLDIAMLALTSYLRSDTDRIDVDITVNGEERPFLNDREQAHMADVARLFRLAECVRIPCGIIALVSAIICVVLSRRKHDRRPSAHVGLGMAAGGLAYIMGAGLIAIPASMDFYSIFYKFHERMFTNDLWLLNPDTDFLIRLMPTAFFAYFAAFITLAWLAWVAAFIILGFRLWAKRKAGGT